MKRGFFLEFVEFTKKKGTVDAAMLIAEFNGRQIDGHKVTPDRVKRYIAAEIAASSRQASDGPAGTNHGHSRCLGRITGIESPLAFLERHLAGDWGELSPEDTHENELSLQRGWRIVSVTPTLSET